MSEKIEFRAIVTDVSMPRPPIPTMQFTLQCTGLVPEELCVALLKNMNDDDPQDFDVALTPKDTRPGFVPSWDDAPDWAMWAARDKSGAGYWFAMRPSQAGCPWWRSVGKKEAFSNWREEASDPDWKNTLQRRPEPERPRPEFVCPDCGAILEKDVYEVRGGPCTVWVCECLPAWNRRA